MSDRKQTPDILAEILGGPVDLPETSLPAAPVSRPVVKRAKLPRAVTQKPAAERKQPVSKAGDFQEYQRWEHRIVSFQEYRGWRVRFVDGVEVPDWIHGMTICEYIASVSQEGWEVAGACTGQAMFGLLDKYQIYLKRSA